jgi:hypothetical protein
MLRQLFLGFAAFASAAGADRASHEWSDAARKDVEAGYRLFQNNHPGWMDKSNPGFRRQLELALKRGLLAASAARDEQGYEDALGTFSGVLGDGHARLIGTDTEPSGTTRWPGFVTAWRGQRLLVAQTTAAGPVLGAEVLECGRRPIRVFIKDRLVTRGMRPNEAGQWWSRSPRALVDSSDASGPPPSDCLFRTGSRTVRRTLTWSPAPADMQDRLRRASDGERTPIGLSEPRPGIFLIGLPDFSPDEAGRAAYRHMFIELEQKRAILQRARAIVIDLRFNDGGSDEWPFETAKALWGRGAVETAITAAQGSVQIWWRASAGNVAYVEREEKQLRQEARPATAEEWAKIGKLMQAALHSGHPFAIEPRDASPPARRLERSRFSTPVYVITPGRCASACLDAVDAFKLFPNTRLVGAPTSADSQYLEIRTERLPSGHGIAVIPIKVWMYRPRKGGAVYSPDIEATQLDWSTKAFLDLIETRLPR